jgi:hypothetical protein
MSIQHLHRDGVTCKYHVSAFIILKIPAAPLVAVQPELDPAFVVGFNDSGK